MSTTIGGVRIVDMPDLGAFNSASSLVGERAGSGRFSASGLTNYLTGIYLPMATGGTVNGPTSFSGTSDGIGGRSLSVYVSDWMTPIVSWPMQSSHVAALSPIGQMAVMGASELKDGGGDAIGIAGFGFNNIAGGSSWGGYFESRQYPNATQATYGVEIEVANVSGIDGPYPTPQSAAATASYGLVVASGAGVNEDTPPLTAKVASGGIFISGNPARFQVGILFGGSAIQGTDGLGTGQGTAMLMAPGHAVAWTLPDNTPGPLIVSKQTTGVPVNIAFDNNFIGFLSTSSVHELMIIDSTALGVIGQTSISLLVFNNAGANLAPVTIGAVDSGGAGYRALRVPN
jgi:hypothetical protein